MKKAVRSILKQTLFFVHFYLTGDSVLHLATRAENEKAAIFLATNGARAGLSNHKVGCFSLYHHIIHC